MNKNISSFLSWLLVLTLSLGNLPTTSAGNGAVMPANTVLPIAGSSCPVGWTNLWPAFDDAYSGAEFSANMLLCRSPGTTIPRGTAVVMSACPSGWTDSGTILFNEGGSGAFLAIELRSYVNAGGMFPASAPVLMQSCVSGWRSVPGIIFFENGSGGVFDMVRCLASSDTSLASLWVAAGAVTVSVPASISFPSSMTSSSTQTLDLAAGQFAVEDLKGAAAGHYVTLSASDLTSGSNSIAKANLSANVSGATVSLLAGASNSAVTVPSSAGTVGAGYTSLGNAVTILQRGSTGGKVGKYGVSLAMRVTIPAYAPTGNYSGTLTVTLIEN